MKRVLIVAPHADDEVLGCGGLIAKRAFEGAEINVIVMGTGGLQRHCVDEEASYRERLSELDRACKLLGVANKRVLYPDMDMRLDQIPMLELVSALDNELDRHNYDEVFFPYSSVNNDHEITYKAMLAALRIGYRKSPALCAAYEYSLVGWQPEAIPGGKYYVDISTTLESKIGALSAYPSQIRTFPHPCCEESIIRLAKMRGMEAGLNVAEMFYILRMVERGP